MNDHASVETNILHVAILSGPVDFYVNDIGFLERNRDSLPNSAQVVMAESDLTLIQTFFQVCVVFCSVHDYSRSVEGATFKIHGAIYSAS